MTAKYSDCVPQLSSSAVTRGDIASAIPRSKCRFVGVQGGNRFARIVPETWGCFLQSPLSFSHTSAGSLYEGR